jgi:regulator of extracellular matrix RemA (YlzA/DUF370 family)
MAFVHVGFGEYLRANDIVAVTLPSSAPIQRMVKDAKQSKKILNFTSGRRAKAAIFTESGKIALVAITPEALAGRVDSTRPSDDSE